MRLLFVQDLGWFVWGGGLKLNREVAHRLAARGHRCRAVVLHAGFAEIAHDLQRMDGVDVVARDPSGWSLDDHGVEVRACFDEDAFAKAVTEEVSGLDPHCVVFNTGGFGYSGLGVLPAGVLPRTVASVLVQEALPFGPLSAQPEEPWAERFAHLGGAVAMNREMAEYIRRHAGVPVEVLYFPAYGDGPFPDLASPDEGLVTLINVSPLKGVALFLMLARSMRQVAFGAVPTWGTTEDALRLLGAEPNVEILEPTPDIDRILERTRVLLVPSVWQEAFGLVVVEAMLRGVPVLAADVAGLRESTLGVDCLLPVRPITSWRPQAGTTARTCDIPDQDIAPWQRRLEELLGDPAAYRELSEASRQAAHRFVASLTIEPFERFFEAVARRAAEG